MRKLIFVLILTAAGFTAWAQNYLSEYYFLDGFTLVLDAPYLIDGDLTDEYSIGILTPEGNSIIGEVSYIESDYSGGMYDMKTLALIRAREIAQYMADDYISEEQISIVPNDDSHIPGFFIDIKFNQSMYLSSYVIDLRGTPGGTSLFLIFTAFDTEDIPVSVIDNLIEHLNVVIEEAAG